ncbi:MAG: hypothetical protein QE280_11770 [Caulobacter sp.]|nr:hypothetical protein [Caulobacter sp.]
MDANTLLVVSAVLAASAGAGAGLLAGRLMNLPRLLGIGLALVSAGGAGALAWFIVGHDVVPRQAFDRARADAEALPEVRILKASYPEAYGRLQASLTLIQDKRLGEVGVRQQVRSIATATMLANARKATDANVVRLMQLRRDKARALGEKSVAWCYDFTRGARLTFDPDAVVDAALLERERAVTTDILTQTAREPVLNAAGAKADDYTLKSRIDQYYEVELRDQVASRVQSTFPEADRKVIVMLTGRKVSIDDPARQGLLCRYSIALLDETLKLSADKAAMVYRLNMGKGL